MKGNLWEAKDAAIDPTSGSKEPEVVRQVLSEIKSLGDNYKKNYEELSRSYGELKSIVDASKGSMNAIVEERFTKFAEDISTRQTALDAANKEMVKGQKSLIERVDNFEVALQRVPLSSSASNRELCTIEQKDAFDFMLATMAVNGQETNWDRVKKMTPDVKQLQEYKGAYEEFLRCRGGVQQMSPDMFKSLSVGVDPSGGYTVTPYMSSRIIERMWEQDPMRQLCSIESITTGALEMMVDWGQAGYGWEEETRAGSETTTPTWNLKRIPVHVLYAKPRVSQVLLEDSNINVPNWLSNKVADRFSRVEGAAFITGDGIGKPRGILTYATGTNYGQVEQVNMGAAATLTADGFITVKFSLIEQFLNRGTWLMNRTTVAAAMKLKDGAGNYLWQPGLSAKEPSVILGLPVRMSTTMPTIAANALSVALGDWNEAYTIVDRLGITIQRDPFTVKPMVEFYTRKRVGGDVVNYAAIKIGKIAA